MTDLQTIARCGELIRRSFRIERQLIEEGNPPTDQERYGEIRYRDFLSAEIVRCESRMDDEHGIWLSAYRAMKESHRMRQRADEDPRDGLAQARYLLANLRFNRLAAIYDALNS